MAGKIVGDKDMFAGHSIEDIMAAIEIDRQIQTMLRKGNDNASGNNGNCKKS